VPCVKCSSLALSVGAHIGNYQILRKLGAGGMGMVYLAEHRHLKRKSALKLLLRELADRPDVLDRFFAEARATSALDHPGIVRVFDCDADAEGNPYIVMEYLPGDTLKVVLERRRTLTVSEALGVARGMAEALGAAHRRGIVHRDVKPDNLFVELPSDTGPPRVKVVDFGIAKLARELSGGISMTGHGQIMGTALYMSPEQLQGSAEVDHRTDIYALGCVLYEMLCGQPPVVRPTLGALALAHALEPVPEAAAFNPRIPAGVNALIGELLRKKPEERPGSMEDVAARLAILLSEADTTPADHAAAFAATAAPAPVKVPSRTTLGAAATQQGGASLAPAPAAPPPARIRVAWGASAAVIAVAVAGYLLTSRVPASQSAAAPGTEVNSLVVQRQAPPAPPVGPSVQVVIQSNPPGADICREWDRKLLGSSGKPIFLPDDGKPVSLLVRTPGFHAARVVAGGGRNHRHVVTLPRLGPNDLEPAPCAP
jgi:eukaryotic-like serine/threonine-protein kinase